MVPERAVPAAPAPSLKRVLLQWLLLPLALVVPAGAGLQYVLTLRPAVAAFDHALGDAALVLANLIRVEGGALQFDLTAETERSLRTDQFDTVYYVVLNPDGRLLAGDPSLAAVGAPLLPNQMRYQDAVVEGEAVRLVTRGVACGNGTCQVRVAETLRKRAGLRDDALLAAAASMAALAGALALVVGIAVRRALRPLDAVGAELAQRSLQDLRPLPARVVADAPPDVQPLLRALDHLLERLRGAAQAQQTFLADAAHQLRTPLTALRTETELALLEPHAQDIHATLVKLHAAAERAARMAVQMLALARTEAAQESTPVEVIDLKPLAAECAQEWVPRALAAGIDLGFELQPARVSGRRFLLREMLVNLLHNALEYAGKGARVTVRTSSLDGEALLEVEDNGPGIAPEERERVFERFYRPTASPGAGSGLGLTIVRDIARAHGAQVELSDGSSGRGLLVRVRLPRAH